MISALVSAVGWPLTLLVLLGGLVLVRLVLRLVSLLTGPLGGGVKRFKAGSSAPWALVTGASDGLGKEFALQLAHQGYNLVLVARRRDALEAVAAEVSTQSKVVAVDLSLPPTQWLPFIATALQGLDLRILVNNAGISLEWPERFQEVSEAREATLLALNVVAVQALTRLVLPRLLAQRSGLILNLASWSALFPMPMLAPYAASKRWVVAFSEALAAECAGQGVHVEVVTPLYVASLLSKMRPSFTTPTPRAYVRSCLSRAGRWRVHCGWALHDAAQLVAEALPTRFLANRVLALHEGVRRRALAKQARQAQGQAQGQGQGPVTRSQAHK